MITRFAMFEGTVPAEIESAFRAAVRAELVPKWRAFPGARAVRVGFAVARDDGAPEFPMILAIDYDDRAAVETALSSPVRSHARASTESVLSRFFTGRIHHHVTEAESFAP